MSPEAVLCVHIWFIKYTAFHCGTTAEKGTSEVFVSLQPRMPGGLHACILLLQLTPVGVNCKVYLPDKGTGSV